MAGPWRRYASKAAMSAIFSSMKGWREPGPGGVSPGADRRIRPAEVRDDPPSGRESKSAGRLAVTDCEAGEGLPPSVAEHSP